SEALTRSRVAEAEPTPVPEPAIEPEPKASEPELLQGSTTAQVDDAAPLLEEPDLGEPVVHSEGEALPEPEPESEPETEVFSNDEAVEQLLAQEAAEYPASKEPATSADDSAPEP